MVLYLPSMETGGAERSLAALINGFSDSGLKIELLLNRAVGPELESIRTCIRVVDLKTDSTVRATLALAKYLATARPRVAMSALDLPNMQMILARFMSFYRGKVILLQRAALVSRADTYFKPLHSFVFRVGPRFTYPFADVVISNSFYAANQLHEQIQVKPERTAVIPNFVNVEQIKSAAKEPLPEGILSNRSLGFILAVGSLTPRKDFSSLINAFALIRRRSDLELVILGEGPERDRLNHLIRNLDLVNYVHMPGIDLNPHRWASRATLCVSSSTLEGFPNAIAEALAVGSWVVATDCPGDTSILLQDGALGTLVPPKRPDLLADAILAVLGRPSEFPPPISFQPASFEATVAAYLEVLGFQANASC